MSPQKTVTQEQIDLAKSLKSGVKVIFIVDDSFFAIDHFFHLIKLIDPDIEILSATTTAEAKEQFLANMDRIDIVLMDYRLADAASGEKLTKSFLIQKPDVIILANSAMSEYNTKLINAGAIYTINKKIPVFFEWWNTFYSKS